jgi:hypothetical protein
MKLSLLDEMDVRCTTVGGHKIYREATHRENRLRSHASEISANVLRDLKQLEVPDVTLRSTIDSVRSAHADPHHYGDNKPGSWFTNGTSTVPDPVFDYWDFVGFGLSGDRGYDGFAEDMKLDANVTYRVFIAVVALLLVDSAIAHLDAEDLVAGASDLIRAAEAREEMFTLARAKVAEQKARRAIAQSGGIGKHRETRAIKKKVLEKWATGVFENNKTNAARWACANFPKVESEEVVRRWIRAYEKD